ncbi:hypothetical protein D3C80_1318940 [compost metagenome]
MSAQDATLLQHQADQFLLDTPLDFRQQSVATDELALSRLPGNAPAQVRRQRRVVLVDVLAIQVHARFKAQGIAGAKAARSDTGTDQVVEEGRRLQGG